VVPLFATYRHRPCASFAMALGGDCVAPRNYRSAGIKCGEMIRVVLTDAVYDAIASTLPKGAARWPMQRERGPMLHPSRGGGGRPHEGHAQAQLELQGRRPEMGAIRPKRASIEMHFGQTLIETSATLCDLQPQPPAHARAYISPRRLLGSVPLHFLSRCQALSNEIRFRKRPS
jgi:hypothetical protein